MKPCAPVYIPMTAVTPLIDMAANMYGTACTQALLVFEGAEGEYSAVFHRNFQSKDNVGNLHRYITRSRLAVKDLVPALLHGTAINVHGVMDFVPWPSDYSQKKTAEGLAARGQQQPRIRRFLAQALRHRLCRQKTIPNRRLRSILAKDGPQLPCVHARVLGLPAEILPAPMDLKRGPKPRKAQAHA